MRTRITTVALVALFALLTTTAVAAAAKPTATTGGHSALTPISVTLLGKVNPGGTATSYYFQYGTTKAYGTQTGPVTAGTGTASVNASAAVVGLTPNTTYHFRVVAVNTAGVTAIGTDAAFTTPKQPLGLSLAATPNPVPFGASTTVNATLTGTDKSGRTIILQQRPFPYTAPFVPVGNAVVTNSSGIAGFPILSLPINTQYRALVQGTSVTAPIISVQVSVGVHLNLRSHHVHSGSRATFSGTVTPAEDGALFAIQKFLGGTTWKNVAGGSLHHSSTSSSKFSIHVKVTHSGVYRVFVGVANGQNSSASSADVHLIVIPKKHH